ncbi:uncharacterized protein [Apostichopus japonicus]|uniref:uncharacterized protein n=1 Tax=Stichopus japonicus TaxID=307972 RepID=UPI003AB8141A
MTICGLSEASCLCCTRVISLLVYTLLLSVGSAHGVCQDPPSITEGHKSNVKVIQLDDADPESPLQVIGGTIHSPGFESSSRGADVGHYTFKFVALDRAVCLQINFTDFLLEASLQKSAGADCGPQDSHLKITNGLNSTFYCGVNRPRPLLSSTQCLTLELIITSPNQMALLRAVYKVLPINQCGTESNRLSPPLSLVQKTKILTSDFDHLDTSIPPWSRISGLTNVDYLWYIKIETGYLVFTLEDFEIGGDETFEVRDGWTSSSPLIFTSASESNIVESLASSGTFVRVRWFGRSDNTSKIHMYYSSIQRLGPQVNNGCFCENNGICIRDSASWKCFCMDGFVGKRCQIPVQAKAHHHLAAVINRCSCRNGGTCTPTSTGFGFVCSCPAGFSGLDCAKNNTSIITTSAEYGIAMGAAVVAVLLVMFGIALCMCVILQYIRQQREGPEGNYRPALSRDVYSVEGVNISGILRIESLEANNYIPPSYSQCVHSTPNSPIESEVFLSPAHSNQSVRAWHQLQRAQRTPDSPPPTYDAIIGICKQCSQLRRGGRNKMRHMKSLGSEPALIRYTRGQQILFSDQRPISLPTTPQDDIEMQEVR